MATAKLQREWNIEDRSEARSYNLEQQRLQRLYDEEQQQKMLRYNEKMLDESRAYSRQVLGHLVEDAEKAGFNPLTVLRGGGGANYNAAAAFAPLTSTQLTGSALVESPMYRTAPNKRAVAASPVADGLSSAADAFLKFYDPYADQRREESYRIISSQVASQRAGALSGARAGFGSGAMVAGKSSKAGAISTKGMQSPVQPEQGTPKITNPWQMFDVNPNLNDAADYEQRYGEFGGSVLGFINAGADIWQNRGKAWNWIKSNWKAPPPTTNNVPADRWRHTSVKG